MMAAKIFSTLYLQNLTMTTFLIKYSLNILLFDWYRIKDSHSQTMRFLVIKNATYFKLKINVKQKPQSWLYVESTFFSELFPFRKEKTKQNRKKKSVRGTLSVFVLTENCLILEMLSR